MWLEASTQVFFALGLGMGPLIGLSSHSKRSSHVLRDAIVIGVILLVVSLFAATVVFSVVGFKAQLMKMDACELVVRLRVCVCVCGVWYVVCVWCVWCVCGVCVVCVWCVWCVCVCGMYVLYGMMCLC